MKKMALGASASDIKGSLSDCRLQGVTVTHKMTSLEALHYKLATENKPTKEDN